MKHYRYFISLLGAITLMTACDFLDVVPDDAPTIEDAFKNRAAAEKALFTCYSFLPDPTNPYDYPAYFTSHDEFEIGSMHWIVGTAAYAIANGQQNANSPKQNYWPTMYRAIRYCNIFLEGIGTPRDIPEYERKRWIAEVKFLKAYYHYWLVSLYGPVAIVDRNLDISTPTEETMVYREPVDECIDYIVNLLGGRARFADDTAQSYSGRRTHHAERRAGNPGQSPRARGQSVVQRKFGLCELDR